jgi:RNA polymerase sigma-70 factor, ECF subfamily
MLHSEKVDLSATSEEPRARVAPRTVPDMQTVVEQHAAFLLRAVRRLGVAETDVEDVAQEVLLIMHRKADQYDPRCSMRGWMFGIATRLASDYRKSARVRRERVTYPPPETSVAAAQEHDLDRARARALLDLALDDLDDDKRAVFVLYELEGLEMQEVVALLGCPLQTGYSRLHAARAVVRERVERALARKGDR